MTPPPRQAPADYTGYRCPGCLQPLPITTARQRRRLAGGGQVFHSRECQKVATLETRQCANPACGKPITRRRSEFGNGPAACDVTCRGGLKKNGQEYPCACGCGTTVYRTPGNTHGAIYASRECFSRGSRSEVAVTATCANPSCGVEFRVMEAARIRRVADGKPVYHSRECQKATTRVELPCSSCGTSVWRYRSQLSKGASDRPARVFCDNCIARGDDPRKPRRGSTKPCGVCGTPVYRRPVEDHDGLRYCSPKHRSEALRGPRVERPERACEVCGTVFFMEPDQVRQNVRTCGNRECAAALRRRKPGERYIEPSGGYVRITTPDGRDIAEHRYKMEVLLSDILDGQPLPRGVNVHHINGDKADNTTDGPLILGPAGYWRSGNLELWFTSQPSGQRLADLIQSAMTADLQELAAYRRLGTVAELSETTLRAQGYRPVGELLEEAQEIVRQDGESLSPEQRERLRAAMPQAAWPTGE